MVTQTNNQTTTQQTVQQTACRRVVAGCQPTTAQRVTRPFGKATGE